MALGLAFESSCDETGVALVENGRQVLAAPLFSQIELHSIYGGVVPEYASRAHLEKFSQLLHSILKDHNLKPGDIDYVAVTTRPGLVGALLVGYQSARAAARYFKAPLIGVHHLEAHLAAIRLSGHEIPYPALGLLLSGGNSAIYLLTGPGEIKVVGDTLDDAAGEALDKAAQLLSLGYPGGPVIEKAAQRYRDKCSVAAGEESSLDSRNMFPVILKSLQRDRVQFSFSGVKTSLMRYRNDHPETDADALAFFYQERIVEHIGRNLRHAMGSNTGLPVIAAGGVLANTRLRTELAKITNTAGVQLLIPEFRYCTDNAAMVAAAAHLYFEKNIKSSYGHVSSANVF